jgi:phytoene dehydrogenase-like protein
MRADTEEFYDVAVVGGGHNALVAACYLALAGKKVIILEKQDQLGGATVSVLAFPEFEARLSRYSYLVSLLPDQILSDLSLNFQTLSRSVSSFTPYQDLRGDQGLLINREFDDESRNSLLALTPDGSDLEGWQKFYSMVESAAKAIAPTLLKPLPTEEEARVLMGDQAWLDLVLTPLGRTIEKYFSHDLVKGVVLTDGLIGTFANSENFAANICFLYHLIGNGTGEWKVPKGGMGVLVTELERRAKELGVEIRTNVEVIQIEDQEKEVFLRSRDQAWRCSILLAGCSPQSLSSISDLPSPPFLEGSQLKINMLLTGLPQLKSGIDPRIAFAGTFHIDEGFSQLERAYEQASRGEIPNPIPAEMYCHTLTDPSILSSELQSLGFHTLTLFALHTPAALFDFDHDKNKMVITERLLERLNRYLKEPIEKYLAYDSSGMPCIEVKTPQELEQALGLPRGNIFHGDLSFPWKSPSNKARWGVETVSPRIFIAGAGARRGGGVSGISGHNAAMAALETFEYLA